jgi:hypothetical protein
MIRREILDAIDFLNSLKEGEAVTVSEGTRELPPGLYVSRTARRCDGAFGSVESTHVTITYGPGRYTFEVHADTIGNGRHTIARRTTPSGKASHDEVLRFMEDLEHGTNLFGPFDPQVRARLFAVLDTPTQETWADAHTIILSAFGITTTLWRALLWHTDYDVTSGPAYTEGETPGPWAKLPTSEQLFTAIRNQLS